uniref:CCHC-type domain-containing protein n=1 Tax=Phyllostachys edulis TaxID=38705 RepID=Q0MX07_PHYED|nr:unknown [Phyllostachys edulis]
MIGMRMRSIKWLAFMGGLRHKTQDIVDYKEYNDINRLFQLAYLAEKELQGRQQRTRSNFGSMSTSRSTLGQAKTALPPVFRSATPFMSRACSAAPPPPSRALEMSKSTSVQAPAQSSSSVASTGRTTGIVCHHCKGMGHVMKDCPSQRAYIAT